MGQTLENTESVKDVTTCFQFLANFKRFYWTLADSFIDPFAQVTIRDKELLGISGNHLDYYSVKSTSAVDFRSDNLVNFKSLEKFD